MINPRSTFNIHRFGMNACTENSHQNNNSNQFNAPWTMIKRESACTKEEGTVCVNQKLMEKDESDESKRRKVVSSSGLGAPRTLFTRGLGVPWVNSSAPDSSAFFFFLFFWRIFRASQEGEGGVDGRESIRNGPCGVPRTLFVL